MATGYVIRRRCGKYRPEYRGRGESWKSNASRVVPFPDANEAQTVASGCRPGVLGWTFGVVAVEEVMRPLRLVSIGRVQATGAAFYFDPPILAAELPNGTWRVTEPGRGLRVAAPSREALERAIAADMFFMWDRYVLCDVSRLTPDAVGRRRRLCKTTRMEG